MRFVFKFIWEEKLLFFLNLFFIFLATFFLVSQIFVIANIASFTINLEKARIIVENGINFKKTDSYWSELYYIYQIYLSEGNLGVANYVLSLKSFTIIFLVGVIIFIFVIFSQLVLFFKDYVANYFAKKVGARIRKHFFDKMIYFPISFYRQKQSGDIISRITNDTGAIENSLQGFFEQGIFGTFFTVVGLGILLYLNLQFSIILFIFLPIIVLLISFIAKLFKRITINIQEKLALITNKYSVTIYGIDIIKIFSKEEYEKNKFAKEIKDYLRHSKKQLFFQRITLPINEILIVLAVIVIVLYGSNLIWQERITMDVMLTFVLILIYVSQYIQRINQALFITRNQINVASERLVETLNQYPMEKTTSSSITDSFSFKGNTEFKRVYFGYNDNQTILQDISFKVKQGDLVAIVGGSGQGKTTLMQLIPLLFYPTKGEILYDKKSHLEINLKQLRENIAVVTQENILFPGTIKENIEYAKDEPHDFNEVKKAAKAAMIDDFIDSLEEGYETLIGERGVKLSGGQRQRLCIARAIYKKPRLLLLDEATSSLDSQSEEKIQVALNNNFFGKITTFIVSHRLSTITKANKVLVIENGKIKESGTHRSLLAKKKIYYRLFKNQLTKN